MSLKPIPLTAALLPCLMLIGTCASAGDDHDHDHGHHDHDDHGHDEHRQHGTHVHGIAALNLASEGKEVHVELDSPAANIVGFEHAPSSAEDRAALDQAIATLSDGAALLEFNDDAGCELGTVEIRSQQADKEDDGHAHEHGDDHDDHGHEDEGETHSDIHVEYHFECDAPEKLTRLSVELFEAFAGMERLNVQYVIETKQGAAELTAADHVIEF